MTAGRACHPAAPEQAREPQPGPWPQHIGTRAEPHHNATRRSGGRPAGHPGGARPSAHVPARGCSRPSTCSPSRRWLLLSGCRLTPEKRSLLVGVNICPALEFAKGRAARVKRPKASAWLEGPRREGTRPRSLGASQVQDEYPERPGLRLNVVFLNQK